MSGSSLDGLDIAHCHFEFDKGWKYRIEKAITYEYTEEWINRISNSTNLNAFNFQELDNDYGRYIGNIVKEFIRKEGINPQLIASHGHTIFHEPERGFSTQIGNGQSIAYVTGVKTIYDFRNADIQAGGQGAPLVPIGDKYLFEDYDYCINLGGIANISFDRNMERVGFDICHANQVLNHLSMQIGFPYDKNGNFAQLGKMDRELFEKLNKIDFYKKDFPKSMSNQMVQSLFIPIVNQSDSSVEDKLYTVCKHISYQIRRVTNEKSKILVTGGGAHNSFLINAIKMETNCNVIVPDATLIDFKEALIFGFMGVLRLEGQNNTLSSVTGAKKDTSGGIIADPYADIRYNHK